MEERKWKVYIHTNKINGKMYVGITSKDNPNKRWLNGKGYLGTYFGNAIQKYGWDGFNHEIIFEDLSQEQAEYYEKKIIKDLKTNEREYGYNVSSGGLGIDIDLALTGLEKARESSKKKVVRLNDGKIFNSIAEAEKETGVWNPLIVKCCKGIRLSSGKMLDGTPMFWSYYSEDLNIKEKLEVCKQIKKQSRYTSKCQKVVCINTGEIFLSLSDAENKYNVHLENIIKCCKGKYGFAGRLEDGTQLKWKYYIDYIKMSEEEIDKYKNTIINNSSGIHIRCLEDGKEFSSIREAKEYYHINFEQSIHQQLIGRIKNIYINNRKDIIHFEIIKEKSR